MNRTSCESEREFSVLSLTLGKTRHSLDMPKVEMIMFLRMNADRVKDIQVIQPLVSRHGELCDTHMEKTRVVQAQKAAEKGRMVEVID